MNRSSVLVLLLLTVILTVPTASAWCGPLCQYTGGGASTVAAKRAIILSPLEAAYPTWHISDLITSLRSAGYRVDVITNGQVSVQFLRTQLRGYSLIILRTDSFLAQGLTYYCTGMIPVPPTGIIAYQKAYASQIQARELQVSSCLAFSLLFLQHNYPSGLNGLLYVVGANGQDLANPFLSAGGKVAIGYEDAVGVTWGRMDTMTLALFKYLTQGYTVIESFARVDAELHSGHGGTADWPEMYWLGNGDFKI
jgi:hypothetical protein